MHPASGSQRYTTQSFYDLSFLCQETGFRISFATFNDFCILQTHVRTKDDDLPECIKVQNKTKPKRYTIQIIFSFMFEEKGS